MKKFKEGDTYFSVEPKVNPIVDNFAYVSQSCWDDVSEELNNPNCFETLEEALRYCEKSKLTNLQIGLFEGLPINLTLN